MPKNTKTKPLKKCLRPNQETFVLQSRRTSPKFTKIGKTSRDDIVEFRCCFHLGIIPIIPGNSPVNTGFSPVCFFIQKIMESACAEFMISMKNGFNLKRKPISFFEKRRAEPYSDESSCTRGREAYERQPCRKARISALFPGLRGRRQIPLSGVGVRNGFQTPEYRR